MSYVPNNDAIFVASYSGAMSGMGVNKGVPLDKNSVDYAVLAAIAGAWAQSFDTSWGANPNSTLDADMAQSLSEEAWGSRTPSPQSIALYLQPLNWKPQTDALVAQIAAAEAYFTAQGISPTPPVPPTTPGNLDLICFALALATANSATSIPAGALVVGVSLLVTTPYSGGATIAIGRAGSTSLLMGTGDNTPQFAGEYQAPQTTAWGGASTPIVATVGGGPALGAALVTVQFGIPNG